MQLAKKVQFEKQQQQDQDFLIEIEARPKEQEEEEIEEEIKDAEILTQEGPESVYEQNEIALAHLMHLNNKNKYRLK